MLRVAADRRGVDGGGIFITANPEKSVGRHMDQMACLWGERRKLLGIGQRQPSLSGKFRRVNIKMAGGGVVRRLAKNGLNQVYRRSRHAMVAPAPAGEKNLGGEQSQVHGRR